MSRYRVAKTGVIFLVTIGVGCNLSLVMTTLPAMEVRTSSSTAEMSTVFVWIALAHIGGTLTIGSLFGRVNGMLLTSLCLTVAAMALSLAPTWPNLTTFKAFVALNSFFNCALFAGTTTMNINLWKGFLVRMRQVVQATHLMNMLGMAIGPQIVRPFLDCHHLSNDTAANDARISAAIFGGNLEPVQVAYVIGGGLNVGLLLLCVAVLAWSAICNGTDVNIALACVKNLDDQFEGVQLIPDSSETAEPSQDDPAKIELRSKEGFLLFLLAFLFFACSVGYDSIIIGLQFTYVYEYLDWSADGGTILASSYHATRMIVHGIVVALTHRISPMRVVAFDMVAMIVSSILMLAAVSNGEIVALTAASFIIAGMASSKTSSMITRVEETLRIAAPQMAVIFSSFGLGAMTLAPLCGALLHKFGALSYPLLLLAISLATTSVFLGYLFLPRLMHSSSSAPPKTSS